MMHRFHKLLATVVRRCASSSGNGDLASLRRHQRRLLYGGGAMLTLIVVLTFGAVTALRVSDYQTNQLDEFNSAKLALDSLFIQRDAGYVRTLNMAEYAWRNRRIALTAVGNGYLHRFVDQDERAIVRAGPDAMPWLTLGSGTLKWPRPKLDRYLGLVAELSVISRTSMFEKSQQSGTIAYFYDPSASFFAFGQGLDEAHLHVVSGAKDRASLLAYFAAEGVDFSDTEALLESRKGNAVLSFYGSGLPQIRSSFGTNPLTGEPAIIGSFAAFDEETPIGAFVVFEPIQRFVARLREVTHNDFSVITHEGEVVLDTGPLKASAAKVAEFRAANGWVAWRSGVTSHRYGGKFFIADRVKGTDWSLVYAYSWHDIVREEGHVVAVTAVLAVLVLLVLWLFLWRLDRRIFTPTLARALRVYQSEQLNRAIIETSPVGLCLIATGDDTPIMENDLMRDYASSVSTTGTSLYTQLVQGHIAATDSPAGRLEAREFDVTIPDPATGTERHLLVAATRMTYQDRRVLLCVLRDLTARIELEEAMERAREAAESASHAKSAFVTTMSHEIRTPLTGILGHLELLEKTAPNAHQHQRLGWIRQSADSLLSVISDVLDFSKIEAGQLDIENLPFDLHAVIEQVALLYAPVAQGKGIRLYYLIDPALTPRYVGGVARIEQVLRNLISNAIKFTHSGKVVLRVSLLSTDDDGRQQVRFEVIDSGIGMSNEQCIGLFEPFMQADTSISRRYGGTGLGLALCRQLSELLDGSITVNSTLGVGSVFALDVPLRGDADDASTEHLPLHDKRVALLSSVSEWRDGVGHCIEAWGAQIKIAAHPDELDPEWVASAAALVIFDSPAGAWSDAEQEALWARRRIHARADGPLFPELHGNTLQVSCYSSSALLRALQWDSEATADTLPQLDMPHAGKHCRVLLVDDNPVNIELSREQLEFLGYTVDTAEHGHAALAQWEHGQYDIVLTDINMPVMNGYELSRSLRNRGMTQAILALTASGTPEERARCKQAGITELLLKPLSLDQLDVSLSRYAA
ncbi:MAG: response regulator [Rhodanobacter sp.]